MAYVNYNKNEYLTSFLEYLEVFCNPPGESQTPWTVTEPGLIIPAREEAGANCFWEIGNGMKWPRDVSLSLAWFEFQKLIKSWPP